MNNPYNLSQIPEGREKEIARSLNGLNRRFESLAEVRAYANRCKPKLTCDKGGLVKTFMNTECFLAALDTNLDSCEVFVAPARTEFGEGRSPDEERLAVVIDLHSLRLDIRHQINMLQTGHSCTIIHALSMLLEGPFQHGIDSAAWPPSQPGSTCNSMLWEYDGYRFTFRRQPVVIPPHCTPLKLINTLYSFMAENDLLPTGEAGQHQLLYDRLKCRPDFPAVVAKLGQPGWVSNTSVE